MDLGFWDGIGFGVLVFGGFRIDFQAIARETMAMKEIFGWFSQSVRGFG